MYHLSCGDWRLAWRTGSHSARAVCELGLNHKNVLFRTFTDKEKRAEAIKIFWCAVILDREWGFGSGLPMHLQDGDIDADLPEPVSNVFLHLRDGFVEHPRHSGVRGSHHPRCLSQSKFDGLTESQSKG